MSKVWTVNTGNSQSTNMWICDTKKEAKILRDKLNDQMWVRGLPRDAEVIKYPIKAAKDVIFDKYLRFAVPIEPWLVYGEGTNEPINFTLPAMNKDEDMASTPEITHLEYDLVDEDHYPPTLVFSMEITSHLIMSENPTVIVRNKFKKVLAQMNRSIKDLTIEGIKKMPDKDKIHVPHSLIKDGKLLVFTTEKSKQNWMKLNHYTVEDEDDWE